MKLQPKKQKTGSNSEEICKELKTANYEKRRTSFRFRGICMLLDAKEKGWRCIMNTRTIANHHLTDELSKKDMFTRIDKNYRNLVIWKVKMQCAGGDWKKAKKIKTSDVCEYMGTLEIGKEGKEHFHEIWTFKDVPPEWLRDPNKGAGYGLRGSPNPYLKAVNDTNHKKEIDAFKGLWHYGWSSPQPIRAAGGWEHWAKWYDNSSVK